MARKIIEIRFESSGEGILSAEGLGTFQCLGRPGFAYKSEVLVSVKEKFRVRHSEEFGVDMPWAILIDWRHGAFIHEGPARLESNGGPSAGCIHLGPGDAEKVWGYVTGKTRVLITRPW